MYSLKKLSLAVALTAVFATSTQAVQITGTIDFGYQAPLLTGGAAHTPIGASGSLSSATGAAASTGRVFTGDGAYASVPTFVAGAVTFAAFDWSPTTLPGGPLWSFTEAGSTYTFAISSLTVISQTSGFLNLSGYGLLSISNSIYTPTPGAWTFQITSASGLANGDGKFTASETNAALPDSGSSLLLLGIGICSLGALARFRKNR